MICWTKPLRGIRSATSEALRARGKALSSRTYLGAATGQNAEHGILSVTCGDPFLISTNRHANVSAPVRLIGSYRSLPCVAPTKIFISDQRVRPPVSYNKNTAHAPGQAQFLASTTHLLVKSCSERQSSSSDALTTSMTHSDGIAVKL